MMIKTVKNVCSSQKERASERASEQKVSQRLPRSLRIDVSDISVFVRCRIRSFRMFSGVVLKPSNKKKVTFVTLSLYPALQNLSQAYRDWLIVSVLSLSVSFDRFRTVYRYVHIYVSVCIYIYVFMIINKRIHDIKTCKSIYICFA